jgi:hypothetical protein
MTCNIYDDNGTKFNQNPLPTSNITVVFTIPDKVGIGGKVAGLVRMNPGPLNGPIALKAGTASYSMTVAVGGGSPATVVATGGPNGSQIAPDAAAVSPDMGFEFTTTAAAGSEVSVGISQVEVIATSPIKLTTRCVPTGTALAKVAGVSVVEAVVSAPPALTAVLSNTASTGSSGSSSSASAPSDGGYANCAAAKADGRGTIVRTDPAYRARLDGDGDGLACEAGDPSVLGATLVRTGSNAAPVLLAGAGLIVVGIALLLGGRRRAGSHSQA